MKLHINLNHIEWWLDWMNDVDSPDGDKSFWFYDRLGMFLGNHTTNSAHVSFIEKFNQHKSPYRKVLSRYVLNRLPDLTTDSFSEDAISYLIAELSGKSLDHIWIESLFTQTATESFVQERLLPLLSIKDEPFHSNLRIVLKEVGRRHRRRYISEE